MACKQNRANEHDLVDVIQQVSWINLNKIATGKRSARDLTPQYTNWKDVLKEQIKAYNPDIIIGGNTLQYFSNDNNYFELPRKDKQTFKSIVPNPNDIYCYYSAGNKLYMNIHHPSFRMYWAQCIGIDEIITTVSGWDTVNRM